MRKSILLLNYLLIISILFINSCSSMMQSAPGTAEFFFDGEMRYFNNVEFRVGTKEVITILKPKVRKYSKDKKKEFTYIFSINDPNLKTLDDYKNADADAFVFLFRGNEMTTSPENILQTRIDDLASFSEACVSIQTKEWLLYMESYSRRKSNSKYPDHTNAWIEFDEITDNRVHGRFGGILLHVSKIEGLGPSYSDNQTTEIEGTFDVPFKKFYKYE